MFASVQSLGLPSTALSFLRALYLDQSCVIAIGGQGFDGFPMAVGIR